MIKQGTKPTLINRKDYDYHKSFGSVAFSFPTQYITDAGLTMPNQNIPDTQFTPPVPALPYGCTDYTQSEIATDFDAKLKNPFDLERLTGANARGGYDVRSSLLYARSLGWITAFFNIQPHQLDMFDSIRLAMISGIPEKRSVSVGTPWYPKFEEVDATGIITPPTNLQDPNLTWHNWKICGWKIINDQPYLIGKTWQGSNYGDKGFCYFSRPLINTLMGVPGAVAYTATKGVLPPIQTISVSLYTWLMTNLKSLIGLTY